MVIKCEEFCRNQQLMLENKLRKTSKLVQELEEHLDGCSTCRKCFNMRIKLKELAQELNDFGKASIDLKHKIIKDLKNIN